MMSNIITAYLSPDGRYKTVPYEKNGEQRFCLSERTRKGTLITEFGKGGRVIDQIYLNDANPESSLEKYLGISLHVEKKVSYDRVKISASCKKCGSGEKISRELDLTLISYVESVPVVPIFRCIGCGSRFYAMEREYLNALVSRNIALFTESERIGIEKESESAIKELNEYIIRIFASKKIMRLVFEE
jgi:hypothetical protein